MGEAVERKKRGGRAVCKICLGLCLQFKLFRGVKKGVRRPSEG